MSKSKKSATPADKDPSKATKGKTGVLFIRISKEVEDAIQSFQSAQRVTPDRTAVVMTAILEFLEKEGHWPPKKPSD